MIADNERHSSAVAYRCVLRAFLKLLMKMRTNESSVHGLWKRVENRVKKIRSYETYIINCLSRR